MRRFALLLCVLSVALLVLVATAGADVFGPISLASQGMLGGGEPEQAEYDHDPAISGNGQYLAFDGSIGGVTGVWRRDLATDQIEQVAGGDAELPSISENGQYISFTTNEGASLGEITDGLSHEPQQEAVNVYVRDMSVAPTEAGSFTVASAANDSVEPLTYAGGSTKTGSTAVGRSAIDAEGNEVAFVTTAVSNLVSYPKLEEEERDKGEPVEPHTPKLQVAVRYLGTHKTVLVSRCYVQSKCEEASAPAVSAVEGSTDYGAVYPGQSASFEVPPPYGEYRLSPPPGVSLSADGSTVVWMGEDIGQQAPLLSEENRSPDYTEPLWRRIEPGSETSTERVTGGSDPDNPACAASGEGSLPAGPSLSDPCQGPFVVEEQGNPRGIVNENGGQTGDFVPRLSADGYTVAFVSQAPLTTSGENFGRPKIGQESDLYVVNMHPGLTRDQALTPLTELAGGESAGLADTAPIFDFDISPDGSQVAFATVRTRFPLGSPAFVSTPAGEAGMNELFDADLADGTLTRVTHGYQGPDEASEHAHLPVVAGEDPYKKQPGDGALSPSFSTDGDILAFSSTASNLVFGDGNAPPLGLPQTGSFDGSDAFVLSRVLFSSTPTPQEVSSTPEPALTPAWDLGVTALSRSNGSVLLYVQSPGSGTLRAGAQSAVMTRFALIGRAGRRARRSSASRERLGGTVATRTVATRETDAHGAGLETLTLALAARYRALARSRGGLSATVTVTFTAPGHSTLRDTIPVTFLREQSSKSKEGTKVRSTKTHHGSSKMGRR
jgi:WD40-like Beta Propeller Repeat